jgi:hypothetical protein
MSSLNYVSGQSVLAGDRVRFHGETGQVEFVVTEKTGEPGRDWYLDQFPGGGAMITAEDVGSVFLGVDDFDDRVEFVARSSDQAPG